MNSVFRKIRRNLFLSLLQYNLAEPSLDFSEIFKNYYSMSVCWIRDGK